MTQTLIIEAGHAERQYWRDLWKFRELFYFLAWRDFLIRYKQTVVGVAWAVIRPFLMMLALTAVGKISHFPTGGAPYALFFFCGLLPWQFFSTAMSESGNSLVNNTNLVSKIYFPRLVVPASSVIVSLVDFLIATAFLVILMFYYHFIPPGQIVFIPLFVLLVLGVSLGTGFWISALTVEYRDFRFVVPFIVQFGIFVSGVFPMTHHLSGLWRLLYTLNPLVGIIDGFRWCILGGGNLIEGQELAISILVTVLMVFSGLWYFRKTERTFADVI
jgi:lipopolysaccharide transport system permease protein